MLTDDLVEIWAEYDPVEGYGAGLESCKGKLFIQTPEAIEALRSRVDEALKQVATINDADLQAGASKLLNLIRTDLSFMRPDRALFNCAVSLFYVLLKKEQLASFIPAFLDQAESLIRFETARWRTHSSFSLAVRKSSIDAANFMESTLSALKQLNNSVLKQIGAVSRQLLDYRSLFEIEGFNPDRFAELFPSLEKEAAQRVATPNYDRILVDCYDYDSNADQIRQQSLSMLAEECRLIQPLVNHLVGKLKLSATTLESIYDEMSEKFALGEDVLKKSQEVMSAVNAFTNEHVQEIGSIPVTVEMAPSHLEPLITSGATVVFNYLTDKPAAKIYVTEDRNRSLLTMLNVLAHEATHAYQALIAAQSSAPRFLKLRSFLSVPISEAMAFHRELEFYDEMAQALAAPELTASQEEVLNLFGGNRLEREQGVSAFQMETRIWRLIRAIRAIFDVEVNRGMKSYVEFVNWASKETTLSKKFIHNECFTFLPSPGYTPSYAISGTLYGQAQKERMAHGLTRRSFNTQAETMAYLPWTLALKKMRSFN